jgi:FtsZ-binding cell division protein ZapB
MLEHAGSEREDDDYGLLAQLERQRQTILAYRSDSSLMAEINDLKVDKNRLYGDIQKLTTDYQDALSRRASTVRENDNLKEEVSRVRGGEAKLCQQIASLTAELAHYKQSEKAWQCLAGNNNDACVERDDKLEEAAYQLNYMSHLLKREGSIYYASTLEFTIGLIKEAREL